MKLGMAAMDGLEMHAGLLLAHLSWPRQLALPYAFALHPSVAAEPPSFAGVV